MSNVLLTMPEPKYRSIKKNMQPGRSIPSAEYRHEVREFGPRLVKASPDAKPDPKRKIAAWWPVAVGLFLAGFAPEWHAMAAHGGLWALRLTFPLSVFEASGAVDLNSQFALYIQLPFDGLVAMLTLTRGRSLKSAAMTLAVLHAIFALLLWLISL